MDYNHKTYFDVISFSLKGGSIELKEDGLEFINKGLDPIFLPYPDIANTCVTETAIKKPVLTIQTKDDKKHTMRVSRGEIIHAQTVKHAIDYHCKINAYEESTAFARSPFVKCYSAASIIALLIVFPLMVSHILIGALLCQTVAGSFVGIPIILFAGAIIGATIHSSLGGIEGTCPICSKSTKSNRKVKYFYCVRCKEKILVKKDYFEF